MSNTQPPPALHRLPCTSTTSSSPPYILLHVTPSNSSTEPLNLTLHATDNLSAYFLRLRHAKLPTYRHRQYIGSEDEFASLLHSTLLRLSPYSSQSIHLSATLERSAIIITIRESIGSVSKGIADLKLPYSESEEATIELFDWAGEAVSALELMQEAGRKREEEERREENRVEGLVKKLEMVEGAKSRSEEEMVRKFAELLNRKKGKVRELRGRIEELEAALAADKPATSAKEDVEEEAMEEPKPKRGGRVAAALKNVPATRKKPAPVPKKPAVTTTSRKRKPASPPSLSGDSDSDTAFVTQTSPTRTRTTRSGTSKITPQRTQIKSEEAAPNDVDEDEEDTDLGATTAEEDGGIMSGGDRDSDDDDMPPPRRDLGSVFGKRGGGKEVEVQVERTQEDEVMGDGGKEEEGSGDDEL